MISWFLLFIWLASCLVPMNTTVLSYHPEAASTTSELIEKAGYPIEEHPVTTGDGYILTMHRIPGGKKGKEGSTRTVLLMHGLLCSSAAWILQPTDKALAYVLADSGYDVWMGNFRGNSYARRHNRFSSAEENFWEFTFHELGFMDVPAMIDYILEKTEKKQISYIGHSLGATALFVTLAIRPQYNLKINFMAALAPMSYMCHVRSPLRVLTPMLKQLGVLILGHGEFDPNKDVTSVLNRLACDYTMEQRDLCSSFLYLLAGYNPIQTNTTWFPIIAHKVGEGTSSRTVAHLAQMIPSGHFQQYDHGMLTNLFKYGQIFPPSYPLGKVAVRVALFWSKDDIIAPKTDVEELRLQLPNVVADEKASIDFMHLDYVFGIDSYRIVYKRLIELLDKYSDIEV